MLVSLDTRTKKDVLLKEENETFSQFVRRVERYIRASSYDLDLDGFFDCVSIANLTLKQQWDLCVILKNRISNIDYFSRNDGTGEYSLISLGPGGGHDNYDHW